MNAETAVIWVLFGIVIPVGLMTNFLFGRTNNIWASLFAALVVDFIVIYGAYGRNWAPIRCPHCKRYLKISKIDRTVTDTSLDRSKVKKFLFGGVTTTERKTTYRCQACEHAWEKTVEERRQSSGLWG